MKMSFLVCDLEMAKVYLSSNSVLDEEIKKSQLHPVEFLNVVIVSDLPFPKQL